MAGDRRESEDRDTGNSNRDAERDDSYTLDRLKKGQDPIPLGDSIPRRSPLDRE